MTHRITAIPALLAGSIFALGLAGCASPAASETDGLSVVATTTQVADFTGQVAGDAAQVTSLIQPNQSSHSFDPTAADLAALADADVLIINGAGLEEWLDSAIEASGFAGTTIDASSGVALMEFAEGEEHSHEDEAHSDEAHSDEAHSDEAHSDEAHSDEAHSDEAHSDEAHSDEAHSDEAHSDEAHSDEAHSDEAHSDEAHSDEAHSDEAHSDEAHSEGDDHDHAHSGDDPHIWTSAANAMGMVDAIADGLSEVDAANADTFAANAAAYTAQLEVLDAWIIDNIDQVDSADRLLVTNHEAFGYFVDAYDLTFVGAVIPSFDDNAEVSAADIDKLVDAIRDSGAPAVFSETSLSPDAAKTIADEADVAVFSGDDGLFGDSLGIAGSAGETYIGSMIHNVSVLLQAWGATPTAVPAELTQ